MKLVIFFQFLLFVLLCSLSNAFHPQPTLDLTQVFHHHHHQIKPSFSSNIFLPTDSSTVLDHTRSILPHNIHVNRYPVQLQNQYPYPVYRYNPLRCRQLIRFKGQPRRFELGFAPVQKMDVRVSEAYVMQHRDVPEVESSSVGVCDPFSGPQQRGPLHYNDHDDAQSFVEVKEEYLEDKKNREYEVEKNLNDKNIKHEDEEKENNDVLKKFRKFLA